MFGKICMQVVIFLTIINRAFEFSTTLASKTPVDVQQKFTSVKNASENSFGIVIFDAYCYECPVAKNSLCCSRHILVLNKLEKFNCIQRISYHMSPVLDLDLEELHTSYPMSITWASHIADAMLMG